MKFSSRMTVVAALLLNAASIGVVAAEKPAVTSVDKAGKRHVVQGYTPMKAAPGSKKFAAAPNIKAATLPRKVDLRPKMTPIEDQGETSSCVANAVAGSFEYWVKQAVKQEADVSRLFIYYNARWRSGDQNEDAGSVIQLAMEGLREFGACSEETWPFNEPLLLVKPNRASYQEASEVKIKEMAQVPMELEAWKQALASGYPIVFGCLLFESFDDCNKKGGVVPMPNPADLSRASHGGHAMCAVGYSEAEKVFIVRNSWGDQWGDKGYCYMPYNYLMNSEFNDGDSWVFVPETPIPNPEETWSNDDEPVTDDGRGVDFVINPYTIESYEEVEFDGWEEITIEYDDAPPGPYVEYVEYAEEKKWDAMESFDYTVTMEAWEKQNPEEDPSLLADEEDADADEDADMEEAAAADTDNADDAEGEAEGEDADMEEEADGDADDAEGEAEGEDADMEEEVDGGGEEEGGEEE